MAAADDIFSVQYNDLNVEIQRISAAGQTIYKIALPGEKPIFITRAKDINGFYFWTSIPEGRQKFAGEMGALIQLHFNSKN